MNGFNSGRIRITRAVPPGDKLREEARQRYNSNQEKGLEERPLDDKVFQECLRKIGKDAYPLYDVICQSLHGMSYKSNGYQSFFGDIGTSWIRIDQLGDPYDGGIGPTIISYHLLPAKEKVLLGSLPNARVEKLDK